MRVLDGFRLTEVDGGPCLGLSSCLSRTCGGVGCRHGSWGFSWEGSRCRPVSEAHNVCHLFILSPVVPSVDEVFGLFLLSSKEVSLEG